MKKSPNDNPLKIVAVGASAGGLESLEVFFRNVRKDSGLAFVVIQHLSPDFDSLMDQLLARETEIPIRIIEHGQLVEPNNIYLLPPKKEAIISARKFVVTDRSPGRHLTFPIDDLFRSLAQDQGKNAVAVVLSGTGTDGSRGILDVHAVGGLVAVESESSATFNGMPRSACETGVVDVVLVAHELPKAIQRHFENPLIRNKNEVIPISSRSDDSMSRILEKLNQQFNLDFSHYKMTTICRRVERRVAMTNSIELSEYADLMETDSGEVESLYRDLLIGVTGFFRDNDVFERLEVDVVAKLVDAAPNGSEIRVWSVACATGEEAYSLGILFREAIELMQKQVNVKIFASDMHTGSLAIAGRGMYSAECVSSVSNDRIEKHFIKRGSSFHIAPEIRKMVVFTPHNCITDAPFTKLDLVTCRNLLIYFTPTTQRRVLSLIHFGLKQNGILCLGGSETPGDLGDEFSSIDDSLRIYQKRRNVRLAGNDPLSIGNTSSFGGRQTSAAAMTRTQSHSSELLQTYDKLLLEFMPPSLLVSEKRELMHTFSGAGVFLKVNDGRPTSDILEIINNELRSAVAAAIRRSNKDKKKVLFKEVDAVIEGAPAIVDITVAPFGESNGRTNFLIQLARKSVHEKSADVIEIANTEISGQELESLERELQQTKDNLQSTIEELQVTNEELQAANEELTAANEELQSTNEELHSVNEELYTVNAEHQRKIDELVELTDDMDNLLNSTNVDTLFLDSNLCIRRFTEGVGDTFRLIPQDIGRRFDSFSHKIDCEDLSGKVATVLESGKSFEHEVIDESGRWFMLRILPYMTRNTIDGVVLLLIDIQSLKEVQEQLKQLSEIVEHSDDAIYRVGMDGRIKTWNLGACKLYGFERSEIIDQECTILAPAEFREEVSIFLGRISHGISIDRIETQRRKKTGSLVDVSLTVSPIRDDKELIVGASVIARDITRQKQAEKEIRDAVTRRDQFMAMLSHELRNPLAAILNATSLLKEQALDEESCEEAREVVEHQLHHVARLLDDLLDVARVTNGKLTLQRAAFDLNALMLEIVDFVQHQLDEKSQLLHLTTPDEQVFIEGDIGRLQQAQVNLLVNASKYSGEQTSIHYSLEVDGNFAVITIQDEGVGISAALLPKIFEPFVQAEQTIERAQGGMGLGLPLVQMIVDAHDGKVAVESRGKGLGSCFTIRLPITNKRPNAISKIDEDAPQCNRMLLIEDNAGIRRMLARSLQLKGFTVHAAADGQEGLRLLAEISPDIAVVDVGLPDIDGYEIAKTIRAMPEFSTLLLVAVTGYGRAQDKSNAMEAGFDLHLVKPVDPSELLRKICVLEHSRQVETIESNSSVGHKITETEEC